MGRGPAVVVGALLTIALNGCGEYPLKDSEVEVALPESTAPIVVGETDRPEVRRLLGEPLAGSSYWRFDLFRLSDKDVQLHWYVLPMGFSSQEVTGYVLVTYDERGTVAAYAHDFAREPSAWQSDPGAEAHLVVGDLQFATAKQSGFVAVGPIPRDAYLVGNAEASRCRAVVGCAAGQRCLARIEIDGGQRLDLPTSGWLESAIAIQDLTPGEHRIVAEPALVRVAFTGSTRFNCPAAETRFIALGFSPDDTQGPTKWRRHLFANFDVSAEMPETLRGLPLVIWANGKWLVPQEPGR
jgi:hypothetical protein